MESAFPHGPQFDQFGEEIYDFHPGMTLRDWFAGQALADSSWTKCPSNTLEQLADSAYRMADAMLKALRRQL